MRGPGKPSRNLPSARSQPVTTAKVGLTNSEGWRDRPGRLIQRRAPLISMPITKVRATSATAIRKPMTAMRRIVFGLCSEVTNISAMASGSYCRRQLAAAAMRNLAAEGRGESGRSLPDEEGVSDAPMVGGKRFDAALFGQPAGDPVDIFIAGQRFGGRIGVRGFGIIDVSNPVDRRDELLAVRQARQGMEAP